MTLTLSKPSCDAGFPVGQLSVPPEIPSEVRPEMALQTHIQLFCQRPSLRDDVHMTQNDQIGAHHDIGTPGIPYE